MSAVRCKSDRGSGAVSLFVVLMLPALFIAAGLVHDGGRKLEARRAVQGDAAAAARAGGQYTEAESFVERLDPWLAEERAENELALRGAVGDVTIAGNTVTVTVTRHIDYDILPGGADVVGSASATPFEGVTSGVSR